MIQILVVSFITGLALGMGFSIPVVIAIKMFYNKH